MRSAIATFALFALTACSSAEEAPDSGSEVEITVSTIDAIPARFHGIWDYEGGTCAPASDLRMEISDREILFYESVGKVISVKPEGEDALVKLAMEGEGQTWKQITRLSFEGDGEGERLHLSDGTLPKSPDDTPSKRCEA